MSDCENNVIKAYVEVEGTYETNYGKIITTTASATANDVTYEIAIKNAYKIAKDVAYSKAENEAQLYNQVINYTLIVKQVSASKKETSKKETSKKETSKKETINEKETNQDLLLKDNNENKIVLEPDNCAFTNKEINGIISIKNDLAKCISKNSILYISSVLENKSGYVLVNSINLLENPITYEFNVSWINNNKNSEVEWSDDSKITIR
jgi:hypothetical protein